MTAVETQPTKPFRATPADRAERAAVDASLRAPVLFLFGSSLLWLLLATFLGMVSAHKLVSPNAYAGAGWFTYGRVVPAYQNALVYGWVLQAALGVGLWIAARLCRVTLAGTGWAVGGATLWNVGLTVGTIAIFAGGGSGLEFLEYPAAAKVILFVAWVVTAGWLWAIFSKRRPGYVFVSIWYLLGAALWFPSSFAAASCLIPGARGVMQQVLAAWYAGGLLNFVLPAFGLGILYYLIPKVTGKAIVSYHLTSMAFWSLLFLAGWTGMTRLTHGPVPAWLPTVSIAATIMLLVPISTAIANFGLTMKGSWAQLHSSPTVRFSFFGAMCYAVAGVVAAVLAFRSVASAAQFSIASAALTHLIAYGFVSMVLFGAMYYIIPRLVGCEWLSTTFIRIHFWGASYGMGMAVFSMLFGGIVLGAAWNEADISVLRAIETAQPYNVGRLLSLFLLVPAHLAFAFHFLLMVARLGRPAGEPTLLAHPGEEIH